MGDLIKRLWEKFIGLWNIYGGIIASIAIAWAQDFSREKMESWTSYLILMLTCISVLTFFKVTIFKKKTSVVEGMTTANKSTRALTNALDPQQSGEEIGVAIIKTVKGSVRIMEKIKNFFKKVWGNKFTLISIISNLAITGVAEYVLYSDQLSDIQFFQDHDVACKIVVTAICALWLINNIFTAVTKYGWESLDELHTRAEAEKEAAMNRLTPEKRKTLKDTLATYEKNVEVITKKLKDVDKVLADAQKAIGDLDLIKSLGISLDATQEEEYKTQTEIVNTSKAEISRLSTNKASLEATVEKLEAALK